MPFQAILIRSTGAAQESIHGFMESLCQAPHTLCGFPHTLRYQRDLASKLGFQPLCSALRFSQLGLPLGQRDKNKREKSNRDSPLTFWTKEAPLSSSSGQGERLRFLSFRYWCGSCRHYHYKYTPMGPRVCFGTKQGEKTKKDFSHSLYSTRVSF